MQRKCNNFAHTPGDTTRCIVFALDKKLYVQSLRYLGLDASGLCLNSLPRAIENV